MNNAITRILTFMDKEIVKCIVEKYGFAEKEALLDFYRSQTYEMLVDLEGELYKCSPLILFDMWESEKITGNPRNSQYIRGY